MPYNISVAAVNNSSGSPVSGAQFTMKDIHQSSQVVKYSYETNSNIVINCDDLGTWNDGDTIVMEMLYNGERKTESTSIDEVGYPFGRDLGTQQLSDGMDSENMRRSALGRPWHVIPPKPDGNIGAADRRQLLGYYSALGGETFDLLSTIAAATSLSQITLLTTSIRELATIIATATSSSASANVLRETSTTIIAATLLSQIELSMAAVDSVNKRRSVMSLPWDIIFPVPDGNIGSADRRQLLGYYSALGGETFDLLSTIAAATSTSQIELIVAAAEISENRRRSMMSLPWDIIFPVPDGNIGSADRRHLVGLYSGLGGETFDLSTVIAATTSLSQIALLTETLRELSATITAVTSLSDIDLLTATLRELSTTIAATTSSAAALQVVRDMITTVAGQTDSAATILVLRELQSVINAGTSVSDIELLLATLIELSTTVAATTTTSASELAVLRELAAISAAQTTSTSSINILRELLSTVSAGTSLSQIELLISGIMDLVTTVAATTSTSAAGFNVLRDVTSAIDATTATTAQLEVMRELATTIPAQTDLSQIELVTAMLRELSSIIATTTTTSVPDMLVLRELLTTMDAQSASSASIDVLRELQSIVDAGTSLSQIELIIGDLIELATTIATTTATSTPDIDLVRSFTTTISATTSTSDVSISMVRALSAQVEAGADVGAAAMLVLREFSATIDAETVTSAIDLVVRAAETIIDTDIQSITPRRKISSM